MAYWRLDEEIWSFYGPGSLVSFFTDIETWEKDVVRAQSTLG